MPAALPPSGPNRPAGLCSTCRHVRFIESSKGAQFLLCERSRTDPAYPKYPRLPVLSCRGYEPAGEHNPRG